MTFEDNQRIAELISLIAQGDEGALELLYHKVSGRMFSVAMAYTHNRALAEDVVQESFLKLYRGAKSYKNNINPYGWLCTIVRNEAFTMLKKESRNATMDIDAFFDIGYDDTESRNNAAMLKGAMESLDEQARYLIWLKYYCDMTLRDIATLTKLAKSTVNDIIKRAERTMRNNL